MNHFEEIWGRLSRVLSFLAGLGIMGYETISDRSDRPWLYMAAVGMMGLPIARAAERVAEKFAASDKPIETPGETGKKS